ncbi:hypothetical protein F5Y11DRAFT_44445 [Daldinia sp. FL1419]|nr:hypothetical protein F5Y11DRAFT_44445 [Daldinia sp. FL1419]
MSLSSTADETSPTKTQTAYLKATYTNSNCSGSTSPVEVVSSTAPFSISTPLSLTDSAVTHHKISYLRTLREAVSSLQDRVNNELTARMEKEIHETATAAKDGKGSGKSATTAGVDEATEEENYGEEVVQDDEE